MMNSKRFSQCRVLPCKGGCDCVWPKYPAYRAVFCKETVVCAQTMQHAYIGLGIVSDFCNRVHEHSGYQSNRRGAIRDVVSVMLGVDIGRLDGIPTGELVRKVVLDGTRGKAQLISLREDQRISSHMCGSL